ncbi:type I-E CRISPR-associated protein Cas5/CasD [Aquabacterium lacunae]|uniref:Type I-E CRISPR-associated protein Cas5/CasD n=1 Tax=Aquabacterium lacunae TaxID=2528630 RepID=A0A4Q9H2C1_9BURK|nr:type I-E CRISPR-associated protein Cas5/CasD [Aquabacterium lacunae]TBO27941.1 type I-E CRISPR-associated protein Cas5/CasD [Aquabacterium lacunae]
MATLLMRLQGPMQSWGTTSRFDERDTQLEPSKSGVIGLICAALGRDRAEPIDDLAALRMGVRIDREGVPMRDYQTATGIMAATGKVDLNRTVVSPRFYLADAVFLVGLEGDRLLLDVVAEALWQPVWPLSLGRKSCVPSKPVPLPDAVSSLPLQQALSTWPKLCGGNEASVHRLLVEDQAEGAIRLDQPVAPFAIRRFGPRFVRSLHIQLGAQHAPDPSFS